MNLTALVLTVLLRRSLPEVLRERIMEPTGASSGWSWHGYADSVVELDGRRIPVVSGGAHWGGGLWISALDLARIGQLCLRGGQWGGRRGGLRTVDRAAVAPLSGQARLRVVVVAQRSPHGLANGPGQRPLCPGQRRRPPAGSIPHGTW